MEGGTKMKKIVLSVLLALLCGSVQSSNMQMKMDLDKESQVNIEEDSDNNSEEINTLDN